MAFWNLQDERRLLDSNILARLATQMITLVFGAGFAHKTRESSTSLTCITTLVLSCEFYATMAILESESYGYRKSHQNLEDRTHIAKSCIRSS